jgi:hypothetical protein
MKAELLSIWNFNYQKTALILKQNCCIHNFVLNWYGIFWKFYLFDLDLWKVNTAADLRLIFMLPCFKFKVELTVDFLNKAMLTILKSNYNSETSSFSFKNIIFRIKYFLFFLFSFWVFLIGGVTERQSLVNKTFVWWKRPLSLSWVTYKKFHFSH